MINLNFVYILATTQSGTYNIEGLASREAVIIEWPLNGQFYKAFFYSTVGSLVDSRAY